MELQRVPSLDFEELGLVAGIVIPPKFKVPTFAKYDGLSGPKMHLRSDVRKIQPHSSDKDLWVHFFKTVCQAHNWIGSINLRDLRFITGKT